MINKEQLIEFFDKYDSTFTLETGEQIQAIYFYDLGKVAEDLVKLLNIHSVMQAEGSDGAEGAAVGNSADGKGVCVGSAYNYFCVKRMHKGPVCLTQCEWCKKA
jgi:hypothetical protein